MVQDARSWAVEEYGHAALGDVRRTSRLLAMAERLAGQGHGKVTTAFDIDAEREGAYRWLENPAILQESLADAAGVACARRGAAFASILVPVDKTSATLTDPLGLKGFGAIGPSNREARGIQALSAVGVSPEGDTLGVMAQELWMRPPPRRPRQRRRTRRERVRHDNRRKRVNRKRPTEQKETQRWIDVVKTTVFRCQEHAPQSRCWFQLDREGDAGPILLALEATGHDWTVRSARDRRVFRPGCGAHPLRSAMQCQRWLGWVWLEVAARPGRTPRQARLLVHVGEVELDLRDARTSQHTRLPVRVVWATELGTCPTGEAPLDWLLLTNRSVCTRDEAQQVLDAYATRWRIEEVHRAWKNGGCHVEATQLHSEAAVKKWATLLFTVAARTERLKTLARASPDEPADVALSPYELRALLLLKRRQKKRTEVVSDDMPSIGQAVRWIADLGGYTGKSSGGPPGSITIGRGFARVLTVAEALMALDDQHSAATQEQAPQRSRGTGVKM
jgi:hypothetical protein